VGRGGRTTEDDDGPPPLSILVAASLILRARNSIRRRLIRHRIVIFTPKPVSYRQSYTLRLDMSRGGGRGGRGGGRGGRGGGGRAADLMRETFEDIGVSTIGEMPGRGPPVLYPNIELNPPLAISEDDYFLIQKMREATNRIESSPYFISLKAENTDIVRYSDKYRKTGKELGLMECINVGVSDSALYIPKELLNGTQTGGRSSVHTGDADADQISKYAKKRKRDVDLQKLEQQETAGVGADGKKPADGKKEGDSDGEVTDPRCRVACAFFFCIKIVCNALTGTVDRELIVINSIKRFFLYLMFCIPLCCAMFC
jgi:hypothetical protein